MKKITILFLLFISSYSYSQTEDLMNFYIEPSGDNEVTLETLFYSNFAATLQQLLAAPL